MYLLNKNNKRKCILAIIVIIASFVLCSCNNIFDKDAIVEVSIAKALEELDSDCSGYSDIIEDTELSFYFESDDKYDCYKYTIDVDDSYLCNYETLYNILANIRSSVSQKINGKTVIVLSYAICGGTEFYVTKDGVDCLTRSDLPDWRWTPNGAMTDTKKREISNFIKSQYEYYDEVNGGYSGDKYSEKIMQSAADKYGLTVEEIKVIWMKFG